MSNVDKARALVNEHRNEFRFYSPPKKRGFIQRVKNLAKQVSLTDPKDDFAVFGLGLLETRLGHINLNEYFKK